VLQQRQGLWQAAPAMGRGGTKFESEAIGVRSGRQKRGPSLKDLKKEMEVRIPPLLLEHMPD